MLRTIAVALDGSARSERSLGWVAAMARTARITLVRVVEPPPAISTQPEEGLESRLETARRYLDRIAQALEMDAATDVRTGSAAPCILDAAEAAGAEVIVLTTHGGARLERRLLGRTTEKLLHASEAPLLVVPSWSETPAPRRVTKLLVPLDGSPLAETALPVARGLAKDQDAVVVLAHIATGSAEGGSHLEQVGRRMKHLAEEVQPSAIHAKTVIKPGEVPRDILDLAEVERAQMIVMAAHGYGAVKRALLGSVASDLIRETAVPVLVGRAEAMKRLSEGPKQT